MAIKGKTFDLQTITAKDDGALYRILSGESDMIVFSGSGTALSINSNILTIAECYLLVGGRYIHIEDGSTIDLGTIPNSSNRGRVILKIDTSLGATQVTLDQVVTEIETIASGGSYRALVKNDINSDNGGSVYEIEFATFTCSSGTASDPVRTLKTSPNESISTLVPFGLYNTLNQEITLSESFRNFRKLQFRFGHNTSLTSGGGTIMHEIDIQHYSTYNSTQFGFVYFVNGTIATMSFELNTSSPTIVKIIGLSGASGSGLRCIYGIK